MKLLFIKDQLNLPLRAGADLHTLHLIRALLAGGHDVRLLELRRDPNEAPVVLSSEIPLVSVSRQSTFPALRLGRLERRFTSYWGIETGHFAAVHNATQSDWDAVIVVGLHLLPVVKVANSPRRIWYPADDPILYEWSLLFGNSPQPAARLYRMFLLALYTRVFRRYTDLAWGVTPADCQALNRLSGIRPTALLPNGVDTTFFSSPVQNRIEASQPSCVFWGRLDFEPNIDAVQWFWKLVWQPLHAGNPHSRWKIVGMNPVPAIREIADQPGIELHENLPDIREQITSSHVAVFPFVSGRGIKNKVLEAAALGMPTICTPLACNGLTRDPPPPVVVSKTPQDWKCQIEQLWASPARRETLGIQSRNWVVSTHSWEHTAKCAVESLKGLSMAPTGL